MTFCLHTHVVSENVLTTNTFFIHLLEIKKTFDKKGYAGVVLMNFSKAFDTINHELLIAKLHANEFCKDDLKLILDDLKLIFSCMSNRCQRTKISNSFSSRSAL